MIKKKKKISGATEHLRYSSTFIGITVPTNHCICLYYFSSALSMHDVAWHCDVNCMCSKDAHKNNRKRPYKVKTKGRALEDSIQIGRTLECSEWLKATNYCCNCSKIEYSIFLKGPQIEGFSKFQQLRNEAYSSGLGLPGDFKSLFWIQ